MEKLDLRKQYAKFYAPSAKQIEVVNVPTLKFAMIDGEMHPGDTPETSEAFQQALQALYGISYTLKFMSKLRERNPIDYTVMALEGLWWVESGVFDLTQPGNWNYTLMMMQPNHITDAMFRQALAELQVKRDSPALAAVRLERWREGLCVQTMHVGPYADEPKAIERMEQYAVGNGYRFCGRHHEIYLGDPRRAKPEKLKTVLRHPIERN